MAQTIAGPEWPSRVWARIVATVGVFAVTMVLIDRSTSCVQALTPASVLTARSIAQILNWMGIECQREAATLIHPCGFGYEIGFACTGIIPALLLGSAILVAGRSLRIRLLGAVIGALGILLLNLIRLLSLFYVGVMAPQYFAVAHSVVWQGLTGLFMIGFFYVWKHGTSPLATDATR